MLNGADPSKNKHLKRLINNAISRGVLQSVIQKTLDLVNMGFTQLDFPEYDTNFEGEGYQTITGQNANNSIRVTNDFMSAVERDEK